MGPLFKADLDPLGNPAPAPWSVKPGDHPSAWPDGFTAWVWPTATDGTNFASRRPARLPVSADPADCFPCWC